MPKQRAPLRRHIALLFMVLLTGISGPLFIERDTFAQTAEPTIDATLDGNIASPGGNPMLLNVTVTNTTSTPIVISGVTVTNMEDVRQGVPQLCSREWWADAPHRDTYRPGIEDETHAPNPPYPLPSVTLSPTVTLQPNEAYTFQPVNIYLIYAAGNFCMGALMSVSFDVNWEAAPIPTATAAPTQPATPTPNPTEPATPTATATETSTPATMPVETPTSTTVPVQTPTTAPSATTVPTEVPTIAATGVATSTATIVSTVPPTATTVAEPTPPADAVPTPTTKALASPVVVPTAPGGGVAGETTTAATGEDSVGGDTVPADTANASGVTDADETRGAISGVSGEATSSQPISSTDASHDGSQNVHSLPSTGSRDSDASNRAIWTCTAIALLATSLAARSLIVKKSPAGTRRS